MIDYTSVREAIEVLMDTAITTIPIVFENTAIAPHNKEHLEVLDATTRAVPMDMGGIVGSVEGLLTIGIFTVAGSGTERAREIASTVDALFTKDAINGMAFSIPEFYGVFVCFKNIFPIFFVKFL